MFRLYIGKDNTLLAQRDLIIRIRFALEGVCYAALLLVWF